MPLGPNLLPDLPNSSTFETGYSQWAVAGSSVTLSQDSTSAHGGTYSLRVHGNMAYGYATRNQSGLTVGTKYRFGGWFRKPAADGSSTGYISMQPNGSGNLTLTDTWTEYWVDVTAGSTSLEMKIFTVGSGDNVLADDLYVCEVFEPMDGTMSLPVSMGGQLYSDAPLLEGGFSAPVSFSGTLSWLVPIEGTMSLPMNMGGQLYSDKPLLDGAMSLPMEFSGALLSPLRIPPRPAPAPPETLGVFPMPVAGGVLTQALVNRIIDMPDPVIVDGKPT